MPQFADWLSQADQHRRETGRPLVSLCFAQSLDGCLTVRRGQPTALSGPQSSRLTHQLRAAHDALLIGIGTVLSDNPRLTVRLVEGKDPQVIVLDTHLRMPLHANLLHNPTPPWIVTSDAPDPSKAARLEAARARLLRIPCQSAGEIDLDLLLEHLANLEINSLMVEGGARVITAFLRRRLVDQAVITIAPMFVGGLHAVEELLGEDPERGAPAPPLAFPRLKDMGFEQLGEELVIWGKIV
jgi:3,4-dihydroxy 2-butanone 4-phosphate synthase/GTP cyclohydrolase II